MSWNLVYTTQAQRDAKNLAAAGLKPKAIRLLKVIAENPYGTPPPYEKLMGDLVGGYSRRIDRHRRIVYRVLEDTHTVMVVRLWTHYE